MADFRKSLLLAAVTLAVGAGTASAQNNQCFGNNGVPPLLRAEGVTELTGLISFNCPAVVVGGTANITVSVSAPITSQPTEPYLIVSAVGADGVTPLAGYPITYAGSVVGQAVVFNGVLLPLPGASAPNGFTVAIGGIRVNASTVATSPTAGVFSQINSVITVNNVNVPLNPLFVVGYVVPNAAAAAVAPYSLNGVGSCSTSPTALTLTESEYGIITIAENALDADVFKPQQPIAGQSFDSESGTGLSGNALYPAQSGTQFAIGLTIPAGITVYLPATITSFSGATAVGAAVLVNGPGSIVPIAPAAGLTYADGVPAPLVAITGTGAPVTYYYNVVSSNASLVETYSIQVFAAGAVSAGLPSAQVALAPIAGSSTPTTVIPEFAGLITSGTGYYPLFGLGSTAPCQTTLLFPFMTNQAGFDTGFSIAATSTDPTATQTFVANANPGTCTLYFYGNLAPATPPTVSVSPDFIELHSTVSAVAPGFQGYMMAVCDFVYAHGYAFITDGFMGPGRGLSEGYVANVIGIGARAGTPSTPVGSTGQPESLGH